LVFDVETDDTTQTPRGYGMESFISYKVRLSREQGRLREQGKKIS
jgi:hypothetical protein